MSVSLTTQAGRHPLIERGADLYETPPEATLALMRAEQLPQFIWEPACGRGAIVKVLRAAGHEVRRHRLGEHGTPITPPGYYGRDFLMETKAPDGCEAIVTNPPSSLARAIRRARARSGAARRHAVAALVPGKRPPSRDSRRRRAGARARLPQPLAANASRRMDGAEGAQRGPVRVVLLGPRSSRADDDQSHFVEGTGREHPDAACARRARRGVVMTAAATLSRRSERQPAPHHREQEMKRYSIMGRHEGREREVELCQCDSNPRRSPRPRGRRPSRKISASASGQLQFQCTSMFSSSATTNRRGAQVMKMPKTKYVPTAEDLKYVQEDIAKNSNGRAKCAALANTGGDSRSTCRPNYRRKASE